MYRRGLRIRYCLPGHDRFRYFAADPANVGLTLHTWGQARIMLGQEEAITTLAAVCARHTAGEVRSPNGLLRRMVDLHQQGELRLDRTLFGLADKVRKEAVTAGVNRPRRA